MARFDVRARRGDDRMLLDCQSDFLDALDTRFVVPLLPRATVSKVIGKLNPIFVVDNRAVVLFPQFAFNVPRNHLGRRIGSLAHEQDRITDAIDFLLSGI